MFGFGKDSKKPRFVVTSPNDSVSNIIYITGQYTAELTIATNLNKSDGTHVDTLISMYNKLSDAELFDNLSLNYKKFINIENPTVSMCNIVIIHSDIEEACRFGTLATKVLKKFYMNTIAVIASDRITWNNVTDGSKGILDRMELTEFQLLDLSTGNNCQDFDATS